MAEKDQVAKEKIEHTGIFDFSSLYSFSHAWFAEARFGVNEDKYSEKVKGDARDITIEWKATKDISDYFGYEIKLKFEAENLTEVEAEIDGGRKKMNKGKVVMDIAATLIKDRDGKWETSAFNRFLRDVYNKYVIPARINNFENDLKNVVVNFKEQIKAFFELTGKRK